MSLPNPEPQLYPEPPEPITARHIGDETVIALDTDFALVASKSHPDVWHVVEAGRCDCPGYVYRQSCRHLAAAAAAYQTPCYRCGAPTHRPAEDPYPTCGSCAKQLITLKDD